jgi:hypothetical protein
MCGTYCSVLASVKLGTYDLVIKSFSKVLEKVLEKYQPITAFTISLIFSVVIIL